MRSTAGSVATILTEAQPTTAYGAWQAHTAIQPGLVIVIHLLQAPAINLVGSQRWADAQVFALLSLLTPYQLIGSSIIFIIALQLLADDLPPQKVLHNRYSTAHSYGSISLLAHRGVTSVEEKVR